MSGIMRQPSLPEQEQSNKDLIEDNKLWRKFYKKLRKSQDNLMFECARRVKHINQQIEQLNTQLDLNEIESDMHGAKAGELSGERRAYRRVIRHSFGFVDDELIDDLCAQIDC